MTKTNIKKNKKKVIVVLDAHAIIHRAYHALPDFSNSRGEPTGALYGVVSMLVRILEEFTPDVVIAAYDLPKPTFRHIAYEAYKGTRTKTDPLLIEQLKSSRKLFESFNIPILDKEGFEADDIIGTLAKKLKDKDRQIIIASGDMDTLQLVDDKKVVVFTLRKGVQDTVLYDEEKVKERFGFEPKLLIDYKGLRGDPSDNIIGVSGIGEKTATNLITTFGTIENIYKAIKKNDPKLKEIKITDRIIGILKEHEEEALFSKVLATIMCDVPIDYELLKINYKESVDFDKLIETLQDLEFKSLIPRIKKTFGKLEDFSEIKNLKPEEKVVNIETSDEEKKLLQIASVMLWVYRSDFTTADKETILGQTKTNSLEEAISVLEKDLKEQRTYEVFKYLEEPLIPIIKEMHERGISINLPYFKKLKEKFIQYLTEIQKKAEKIIGRSINLSSPKQVSALLFEELKLVPKGKRKVSGSFTTNAEVLETLLEEHEIVSIILEHREIQKLLTTYIEPLIECTTKESKIHADFYQNGTTTGRFSSAHPNLQNLPNSGEKSQEIKKGLVSSPGTTFISSDYSQIELRVLAMLSGDEKLINSFQEGQDIHSSVASHMFNVPIEKVTKEMRRQAKIINFGILYGMGVTALQKNLGTTRVEATKFYEDYFKKFPTISSFLELTKNEALTKGYTTTLFGRRRYFPTIKSPLPHLRAFAERMASNAPIQGTAADLIKIAIIEIDKELKKNSLQFEAGLVLQIHDELVYEVKMGKVSQVEEIISKTMKSVLDRSLIKIDVPKVPLEVSVSIGKSLDLLK